MTLGDAGAFVAALPLWPVVAGAIVAAVAAVWAVRLMRQAGVNELQRRADAAERYKLTGRHG